MIYAVHDGSLEPISPGTSGVIVAAFASEAVFDEWQKLDNLHPYEVTDEADAECQPITSEDIEHVQAALDDGDEEVAVQVAWNILKSKAHIIDPHTLS